ncbi:MAG: type II 3-dehydroquinate dehydratase [Ilumatobacteraceae bacterium]
MPRSSSPTLLVLNGPNLNLLGSRQPEVYGTSTLTEHLTALGVEASRHGFIVESLQSNSASELIAQIHGARGRCAAIIINPGAFTHYAWSISDALAAFDGPIVEVHLSNPAARESWRQVSVVAPVSIGTIAGFGGHGYVLAVQAIVAHLAKV